MVTLRKFADSLLGIWNDSTPAARIGLAILTILCVSLMVIVGYWSAQPSFVTLVSDIDHEKMANVVDALEKAGITYEVGGAGGVVKVDKRSFARARMIARKQGVSTDAVQEPEIGGSIWRTESQQKFAIARTHELSLEKGLKRFRFVDSADVNLNIPETAPFERRPSRPSASVIVTLAPGARMTEENALAVATTIAFAIQDLEPENVKVSDTEGNIYAVQDEMTGNINSQVEFTSHRESTLTRKAEAMLTQALGFGNAKVQVTLDYTFSAEEEKFEDIDGDRKVTTEENLTTETTTSQNGNGAGGPAGLTSNLAAGAPGSKPEILQKKETVESSFEVPKTTTVKVNHTPVKNAMTVSVLVNSAAPSTQDENGELSPDIKQKVQDVVTNAIGFNEDTDKIAVEFFDFAADGIDETEGAPVPWLEINQILKNVSLAFAALVAFAIGFLTLRKFQQQPTSPEPVRLDSSRSENISQLNDLARSNPEVFNKILQRWAGSRAENQEATPETTNNAA